LTSILGVAETLRKSPCCDPGKLQRGLDIIVGGARAEAQIVDDLIDVSHIVTGTMRLEPSAVELGPLVQACVDEPRPAAAAKGVRIEASIAPETMLRGDPGRLAQVTRNLL